VAFSGVASLPPMKQLLLLMLLLQFISVSKNPLAPKMRNPLVQFCE
jgi:hypothetical protein